MTSIQKNCLTLPSDYADYGGDIIRWLDQLKSYQDCSSCKHFSPLYDENTRRHDPDFGVCLNKSSPRHGLLTFEHQAGFGCYEMNNDDSFPANVSVDDCKTLPTDYSSQGGAVVRFQHPEQTYPLCAWNCQYFSKLYDPLTRQQNDVLGACRSSKSPRFGLLTFKLQAGVGCYKK